MPLFSKEEKAAPVGGVGDILKDVDFLVKHPGFTLEEAKARREAEEREKREAAEAELERQRQRAAERADREAYANEHLNKNILVIINGQKVKPSNLADLKCRCGSPLSRAQDLVIEAGDQHRTEKNRIAAGYIDQLTNPLTYDTGVCSDCKTGQHVLVQVVY